MFDTCFGWVIGGSVVTEEWPVENYTLTFSKINENLIQTSEKFWAIENISNSSPELTKEELE